MDPYILVLTQNLKVPGPDQEYPRVDLNSLKTQGKDLTLEELSVKIS